MTTALNWKVDPRGRLAELFRLGNHGQVYFFTINPGHTRGGHFHKRKSEQFAIIEGNPEIHLWDVNRNKSYTPLDSQGVEDISQFVSVPPGIAHAFSVPADGLPAAIVAWTSEEFDPKDTDTFPFDLLATEREIREEAKDKRC